MGRLGLGSNAAAIFTRGGGSQLFPLDDPTSLKHGRALNVPAVAEAVVSRASDCFGDLGDLHTWAYELVMFRDDQRVWEGPIRRLAFTRSSVKIEAVDVLGWLARRRISRSRRTAVDHPVSEEGELIVARAFADDDPNVLAWLRVMADPAEAQIQRDVKADSGFYLGDLNTLVEQGLNYTTIGRRIVLFPVEARVGKTDTLTPELHMTSDVEVVEEGDDLATAMTAANNDGISATVKTSDSIAVGGELTGVSAFYGLHDMLTDGSDLKRVTALRRAARRALARSYPAPQVVTLPEGSKLSCDAPVAYEDLVPGVVVPVESSVTARTVADDQILSAVTVEQKPDGETVAVSLIPRHVFEDVEAEV